MIIKLYNISYGFLCSLPLHNFSEQFQLSVTLGLTNQLLGNASNYKESLGGGVGCVGGASSCTIKDQALHIKRCHYLEKQ